MSAPSTALSRALPLLELPGEPSSWDWSGGALRNTQSGQAFPVSRCVLDLLGDRFRPTLIQRMLDTRLTAALYDYSRDVGLRWGAGVRSFADEAERIRSRLDLQPGQVVLDLACGHGNFTVAWAQLVGPQGLVVGLDIASAMLARAARRVERARLENVALIRGDALALPFHPAAFDAVNCSGGFHQLPDLPRAIGQLARVLKPGGRLAASTFARPPSAAGDSQRGGLHFVDLERLRATLQSAGFTDYEYEMAGSAWGYLKAQRNAQSPTPSAAGRSDRS